MNQRERFILSLVNNFISSIFLVFIWYAIYELYPIASVIVWIYFPTLFFTIMIIHAFTSYEIHQEINSSINKLKAMNIRRYLSFMISCIFFGPIFFVFVVS